MQPRGGRVARRPSSNQSKFINISPFHIGNKVRTNGDKYAALNPGRRCVELTERTRLLPVLFLLGSLDRFFGGFKFEHDLVVRFCVYVYLNHRRSDHNSTFGTVLERLRY